MGNRRPFRPAESAVAPPMPPSCSSSRLLSRARRCAAFRGSSMPRGLIEDLTAFRWRPGYLHRAVCRPAGRAVDRISASSRRAHQPSPHRLAPATSSLRLQDPRLFLLANALISLPPHVREACPVHGNMPLRRFLCRRGARVHRGTRVSWLCGRIPCGSDLLRSASV